MRASPDRRQRSPTSTRRKQPEHPGEKKISDGTADRESAQAKIDALNRTLQALKNVPSVPKEDKDQLSGLKSELADLKKAIRA